MHCEAQSKAPVIDGCGGEQKGMAGYIANKYMETCFGPGESRYFIHLMHQVL
jgi:hypothetical protein